MQEFYNSSDDIPETTQPVDHTDMERCYDCPDRPKWYRAPLRSLHSFVIVRPQGPACDTNGPVVTNTTSDVTRPHYVSSEMFNYFAPPPVPRPVQNRRCGHEFDGIPREIIDELETRTVVDQRYGTIDVSSALSGELLFHYELGDEI